MPQSQLTFLCFTVRGENNSKIEKLANALGVQPIDFYTMDLEKLEEVAKYRILPEPTLLILHKNKVVGRFVGDDLPTVQQLNNIIELINLTQ
jgi:thiol-disulfide isomerase/thioredoxin